jgi:hypothetical protein
LVTDTREEIMHATRTEPIDRRNLSKSHGRRVARDRLDLPVGAGCLIRPPFPVLVGAFVLPGRGLRG